MSIYRRFSTVLEPHRRARPAARFMALCAALLVLAGCREVRVHTYAQGAVNGGGADQVAIVRNQHDLEDLGLHEPVKFNHEFGVILLLGPHKIAGYRQVIESIRANENRVRVVAFETAPGDGGEPTHEYRTYTLWIVPNSVYRRGSIVDVVTPSGDFLASTTLR